ncbi:MAG TPA: SDR family NAD(P)-dependent oxidoreductase [Phycisphaeraceae bacterium]
MARDLKDKVILITGASAGIGAATAVACAQAGMHVTLAARRQDRLRDVAERIEALGQRALPVACDVARDEDMQRLFESSWQAFGRLDALFANAGYGLCAAVMDTPDDQHRAIFETNYFGTVRCLRHALPQLRATPDGLRHLLICSSSLSEIGLPMYGAYSATKAAQDALASALRGELAHEGVAVTSVHPAGTRTEFFEVAGGPLGVSNTPPMMMQSPQRVAACIVRALRRPRAEVWPLPIVRLLMALSTAAPSLAAWAMRYYAARYRKEMAVPGPRKGQTAGKGIEE